MNKPDYIYNISGDFPRCHLEIIDLDRGNMSVTNGIERVLEDIRSRHPKEWPPLTVQYQDSEGEWAEVLLDSNGQFKGFK